LFLFKRRRLMSTLHEEGKVYKATITDQYLSKNFKEETQVIFAINILAKLKNEKNPADGTEECPQHEREVRITIVPDDPERLRMAVRDLERLGFTHDDISRLHPDHPDCFRLVNQPVYARCRVVNDVEYWNFAWPREKSKPLAVGEVQQVARSLQDI